ncbi:MAG: calcineurin-like phosphoesterase family protein [Tannerellaceae bacterium]|jgi:3',5'-cyclic AMP phosphodiesterase CpdA|nr:calcineurin-like phosphoesterase family protein [Tannerellaceae bacterium]
MRKLIFCSAFIAVALSAVGQSFVTGYVYDDLNHNGKKDRREKGIAQVAVSNGVEVVRTDEAGKYRLPLGDDQVIFVIKPSGYKPALDTFNLPRTYYIHKPNGSPASRYPGAEPTGNIPPSTDFALYKYDEPEAFSAFIFGDPQVYNETELDYLAKGIVTEAAENTTGIRFGITLGDLAGDNLTLHQPYKQVMKQIGLPWYNVMGNHDMNVDAKEDRFSDESFEAHFGPANYAFHYGKAHFIVLDDIYFPHPLTGKGYWGGLREDQLTFVKNNLRYVPNDRLIVLAFHIPVSPDVEGPNIFRDSDRKQLCELLKDYPQVLFLSAHTHFQCLNLMGEKQGIARTTPIREYNVGTTCGDWYSGILNEKGLPVTTMRDGTPQGYAFLRVNGSDYALEYKVLGESADYQIRVYTPQVVRAGQSTGSAIYANFFMGSNETKPEYRIDGGEWKKMQKANEYDPAYVRYVQDWDFYDPLPQGRRPSNPILCQHLWKGAIETNLPAGKHRIEVRALDNFGKIQTGTNTYEVVTN